MSDFSHEQKGNQPKLPTTFTISTLRRKHTRRQGKRNQMVRIKSDETIFGKLKIT